ncbi:MAG: PilZ domain-containing protein [Lachnospiraceae bacterium]|nr:PilZ domain-containing protein [Lachnospiraceae bacterium]MEE1342024.1 PilZ domain-containing protein [Lachnospiraceae bacterium]
MVNPLDKRRAKRLPINLTLVVSDLFKQDNVKVQGIDATIEVFDISKTGIGFITSSVLPLNYYFNAKLVLDSEENTVFTVIKIIRSQTISEGQYLYGCEFVGLPNILESAFDRYQAMIDS